MTKTVVVKYDPFVTYVGGDNMALIYKGLDMLRELGYSVRSGDIEVVKYGPHKDSHMKGFHKAIIKWTCNE